jgi:hypothetical protein
VSSTLCDSVWISQWYQTGVLSYSTSFLEIIKKSQGAKSGEYGGWGITAILFFVRNYWVRREM